METEAGEARVAKAKERRENGGSRKDTRRKGRKKKEKT